MTKVELKIAQKDDSKEWDRLVEISPQGTIFHTWNWLRIVEKYTNAKLYPLIGYKGDTPIGVFPIFFRKKYLKMIFSPPPHMAIPYLGPALIKYDRLKQDKRETNLIEFQKQVDNFINELGASYISFSLTPELIDSRPFRWSGYTVVPHYHRSIDISKGEDYVWSQFQKRVRQGIVKTREKGVLVEEGNLEELEVLYDLLIRRYRELGKTVNVPKKYLIELYKNLYPRVLIFIAKYEGETLTGSIYVKSKNKLISWIGNPKPKISGLYLNELIKWEVVKWAIQQGFEKYELIGASDEKLDMHKRKYNFPLSVHFYVKKSSFYADLVEWSYLHFLKRIYSKLAFKTPIGRIVCRQK